MIFEEGVQESGGAPGSVDEKKGMRDQRGGAGLHFETKKSQERSQHLENYERDR